MSSGGAAIAAQPGRGNRMETKEDNEYQVILPQLPTGRVVCNTVFLHGDVKARPFRVEDFRDMLARVGALSDVIALGAYQINHVWAVTFKNAEATKKMLAAGEQEVKGRRCLVIDPQDQQVRLKLHWLLHGVDDEDIRTALAPFGKVTEITKERWRVQGVLDKGSTTRAVTLKLKAGVTVEDLPHQIRVGGELALLVAPGRPMQCLRCKGTGHVRRECKVPRCSRCRRFGHADAQCVRTYANVTAPASGEDFAEHLMDVAEAEAAAQGTGNLQTAEASPGVPPPPDGNEPKTPEEPPAVDTAVQVEGENNRQPNHVDPEPSGEKSMDVGESANTGSTTKRGLDKSDEGVEKGTTANSEEPPLKTNPGWRPSFKPRPNVENGRARPPKPSTQQPPPASKAPDGSV
ncbi:uncharacterized protein LOC144141209 [Haemaphysalis longicornis]